MATDEPHKDSKTENFTSEDAFLLMLSKSYKKILFFYLCALVAVFYNLNYLTLLQKSL